MLLKQKLLNALMISTSRKSIFSNWIAPTAHVVVADVGDAENDAAEAGKTRKEKLEEDITQGYNKMA